MIEEDGEEVEDTSKRARVGSYNKSDEAFGGVLEGSVASEVPAGEEEAGQDVEHQEEAQDGSDEPSEKRRRTATLSVFK